MNARIFKMKFTTPISERLSFTVEGNHSITTSIVGLLYSCSPSTIIRLVISIIINSFHLMFRRRTLTHVRNEVFKGVSPSIAHCYSASAVVRKSIGFRVVASLLNAAPNVIYFCASTIVLRSQTISAHCISVITAATYRIAALKRRAVNNGFVFTNTLAQPKRPLFFIASNKAQNFQTSVSVPFAVNKTTHGWFRKERNVSIGVSLFVHKNTFMDKLARLSGLLKQTCEPFSLYHERAIG